MSGMRLLCLGVGDAFATKHYSSCFAVESEGRWLLVDCPHPILKMMREASQAAGVRCDAAHLEAVVLTHLHGDHVSGLEMLAYYYRFVLERPLIVYTHAAAAERLWHGVLAGSMEWVVEAAGAPPRRRSLDEFVDLRLVSESGPVAIGPFAVYTRPTIHSVPTIAVKLAAGGRCLSYSCDTLFDPTLLAWLADGDLIIHEASNSPFMHTVVDDLLTAPEEIRGKLRLIHYPDSLDAAACPLPTMQQGTMIEV
ncbi:MAG: MBL fold metallo-hydrolase [Gemmataceae bacterium]|nr:MBL fold metallo-hydrolase [Gemmataceae bacterium]